jgi:hypothetical protein
MTTKKSFSILNSAFCILLMLFTACNKEDDESSEEYTGNETPGEISGLGENGGGIKGGAFTLPDGVTFDGDIYGYDNDADYETNSPAEKIKLLNERLAANPDKIVTRASIKADVTLGSGGLVTLFIPLKNTSSQAKDVNFPAGLIFVSASGEYQNGILIRKTKATVPSGGRTYYVVLQLYCGNASRHASDSQAQYLRPVVSDSPLILYLCGLVKNKKINYEENSGVLAQLNYIMIVLRIQMIVWKVTDNGEMPNQEDLDYINGL